MDTFPIWLSVVTSGVAELYWLALFLFVLIGIVVGVYITFTKIGRRL